MPVSCLIEINHVTPSIQALYEAACRHGRCRSVCLVHTIASGRSAEVEAGQRLLVEPMRSLRFLDRDLTVEARLEIGDTPERMLELAEEIQADRIVMSAHGEGEFPRLEALGQTAWRVLDRSLVPVLLVSPAGDQLCRPNWIRSRRRGLTAPRARASIRIASSPLQMPTPPV